MITTMLHTQGLVRLGVNVEFVRLFVQGRHATQRIKQITDYLLTFTAISLIAAFIAGRIWQERQFWAWIDALYYPLAIFGVLLLFFEGADRRKVATLEANKTAFTAELLSLENQQPAIEMAISNPNLVRTGIQWLGNIISFDRTCKTSALNMAECFVVDDLAPIVAPAQKVLATYTGPEDLFSICTAANTMFQAMSEDAGLSAFIMDPLAEHYFAGVKRGFSEYQFEAVYAYMDEVKPKLEQSTEEMMEWASFTEEERALMLPRYKAQINNGMWIMKAFEACMRAPEEIRTGQYAEWDQRHREKLDEGRALEEEIRQQRQAANELNSAGAFRLNFWPFFLIAALSLKFGKGVAHIRSKKLHIRNILK